MISDIDFMQYIDSIGIDYKQKGGELFFHHCPFCESGNKTPVTYKYFKFNRSKQTYYCWHRNSCGEQGGLYRFKMLRGDLSPITKSKKIEYKKPQEDKSVINDIPTFYEWYEKQRGISQEILQKFEVGNKKTLFDDMIVYHYRNEKGELINRKYRSRTDKKNIRTEKDAEKNFYGLQLVDFEKNQLIVTEGEDDCHALSQMGFSNVVSVPYGAGSYSLEMDMVTKRFAEVILAFDCDDAGQIGAKKFAKKCGLNKCKNVLVPYKDPRECLLHELEFFTMQKYFDDAKAFKIESVSKVADDAAKLEDWCFNSEQSLGRPVASKQFNKIIGGIRTGEVSIIIGHTGVGKSTYGLNLAVWSVMAGMKAMILPFENKIESIKLKLIEICSTEQFACFNEEQNKYVPQQSREWLKRWIGILNEKDLYLLNKSDYRGYYDSQKMREVIEYTNKYYNVNFFLIDHLHYFLKTSSSRNPESVISETMREISAWSKEYNCHIALIVHPHKTEDSRTGKPVRLGLNSAKGSSSIFQEADNYWIVEQPDKIDSKNKSRVRIEKNREGKRKGTIYFDVLENCNTFVESKYTPKQYENVNNEPKDNEDF